MSFTARQRAVCHDASAALALASVLPKSKASIDERDVVFTVLGVTTLGTLGTIVYPVLTELFAWDSRASGIFLGAMIHDVAQVVGAGYSLSVETGDVATATKLLRAAMLVPVVLLITVLLYRQVGSAESRPGFSAFLLGFVALVAVNSFGLIPTSIQVLLGSALSWALVTAIAALGIKTLLEDSFTIGPHALILIIAETLWIALIGLAIVSVMLAPS